MKLSKIRFRDVINPFKWRSVLFSLIIGKQVTIAMIEQYMFRLLQCRPCVDAGHCHGCGCDIPGKMWIKEETCSEGEWGPFMNDEKWNEYKKKYNVIFVLKFNEQ